MGFMPFEKPLVRSNNSMPAFLPKWQSNGSPQTCSLRVAHHLGDAGPHPDGRLGGAEVAGGIADVVVTGSHLFPLE